MRLVRAGLYALDDRRKPPAVLLDGTPAGVLGRGAALDDAGRRGGSDQYRLPKGVSASSTTFWSLNTATRSYLRSKLD